MQTETDVVSSPAAFVARTIERVKADPACRAALRRADNPTTEVYAWEYLLKNSSCNFDKPAEKTAYMLVGAAIARADLKSDGMLNIGAALRSCCPGFSEEEQKTEQTRLRRLLACDSVPELAAVLRRVVRYLQSQGAPLSYRQLLNDILSWGEKTRIRWAQSFFRPGPEDAQTKE